MSARSSCSGIGDGSSSGGGWPCAGGVGSGDDTAELPVDQPPAAPNVGGARRTVHGDGGGGPAAAAQPTIAGSVQASAAVVAAVAPAGPAAEAGPAAASASGS